MEIISRGGRTELQSAEDVPLSAAGGSGRTEEAANVSACVRLAAPFSALLPTTGRKTIRHQPTLALSKTQREYYRAKKGDKRKEIDRNRTVLVPLCCSCYWAVTPCIVHKSNSQSDCFVISH